MALNRILKSVQAHDLPVGFSNDWERPESLSMTLERNVHFEDFMSFSIGPSAADGHFDWTSTTLVGTGVAGRGYVQGTPGVMRIGAIGAANATTVVEHGGLQTSLLQMSTNHPCSLGWRFQVSGSPAVITTTKFGVGFIGSSVPVGTDWITDPDTTLNDTGSVVFTRHAAAYSGDAAGALIARFYASTGGTGDFSYQVAASVAAGTWMTTQLSLWEESTDQIHIFYNGTDVYEGNWNLSTFVGRPSMIVQSESGASRFMNVDYYRCDMQQLAR